MDMDMDTAIIEMIQNGGVIVNEDHRVIQAHMDSHCYVRDIRIKVMDYYKFYIQYNTQDITRSFWELQGFSMNQLYKSWITLQRLKPHHTDECNCILKKIDIQYYYYYFADTWKQKQPKIDKLANVLSQILNTLLYQENRIQQFGQVYCSIENDLTKDKSIENKDFCMYIHDNYKWRISLQKVHSIAEIIICYITFHFFGCEFDLENKESYHDTIQNYFWLLSFYNHPLHRLNIPNDIIKLVMGYEGIL